MDRSTYEIIGLLNAKSDSYANLLWRNLPQAQEIAEAIPVRPRLLLLVGDTGLGKSDLVLRGVSAALRESDPALTVWKMTPADHPKGFFSSLGALLGEDCASEADCRGAWANRRTGGDTVLLVIDDFEQICPEGEENSIPIFRLLTEIASSNAMVVGIVRSPFLACCRAHLRQIGLEVEDHIHRAQPFESEDLDIALAALWSGFPELRQSGEAFRKEVLRSLGRAPHGLAFLPGFFRWCEERDLTPADLWKSVGGFAGIIASHGEEVVSGLKLRIQRRFESLMLRLVSWDKDLCPCAKSENYQVLVRSPEDGQLLDVLIHERVLSLSGKDEASATVCLTHPDLVFSWPRLRKILHDEQHRLERRNEIIRRAKAWAALGRSESERKLTGDLLVHAELMLKQERDHLPADVRDFLESFAEAPAAKRRSPLRVVANAMGASRVAWFLLTLGLLATWFAAQSSWNFAAIRSVIPWGAPSAFRFER